MKNKSATFVKRDNPGNVSGADEHSCALVFIIAEYMADQVLSISFFLKLLVSCQTLQFITAVSFVSYNADTF